MLFHRRIRPRRFRECPLRRRPQFIGDRAAVRLNGKWGFIDPSGATAVPLQYDWCSSFGEYGFDKSVAMVKNEVDKFKVPILSDCPTALIDRKGNRVTPFYGFIFPVRDKVAFVNDGRTDFADTRLPEPGLRRREMGLRRYERPSRRAVRL